MLREQSRCRPSDAALSSGHQRSLACEKRRRCYLRRLCALLRFRKAKDFDLRLSAQDAFAAVTQYLCSQRNEPRLLVDRFDRAASLDRIADKDRARELDALRNVERAASWDLHPHQRRQKARIQKAVNDALGKLSTRGKFIVDMQSIVVARQPRERRDVFRCNGAAETFRLTDAEFTKAIWLQRCDPYRGARLRRSDSQKIRVVI